MSWKLASSDGSVVLDVAADSDHGLLSGTLTIASATFDVYGNWVASYAGGTGNLRPYSAFALTTGGTNAVPDVFIAATGIVTGPGDAPTRIDIQMDTVSYADQTSHHYPQQALFPV